jgi:hypothetical protein
MNSKHLNIDLIILFTSILLVSLLFVYSSFTLLISLGIGCFAFLFLRMINQMGKGVPMKEVMGILLLIQVFVSPLFAYRYFDNKAHFTMYMPEEIYFYYAIPASLTFIIGLYIPLQKEKIDYKNIFLKLKDLSSKRTEKIAFTFILIGLSTTFLKDIIPNSLLFVFYLLKLLKFIGAFILFFSSNKLKFFWVSLVYFEFAYEIIEGGVFYDLFVWGFFIYMLLETKLKSTFTRKLLIIIFGFFLIYYIQAIKGAYRSEAWSNSGSSNNNTELFLNSIENKAIEGNVLESEDDFNHFISRLNNGWILSKVMHHTPKNESFTNGETLMSDLINVLLPRFIFTDKAKTGGKQNQKKFTRFTGRQLIGATTMRIGAISDAYINFGIIGGWITMFFLGLTFNIVLLFIVKMSLKNPFYILWIPFVFAYAIRMSDIQVILNYTFKALIFVIIITTFFLKNHSSKKSFQLK